MTDVLAARIEHLAVPECWGAVVGAPLGRIAAADAAGVELVPVRHVVDGHRLLLRAPAGGRLARLVDDREVVFEVDGWDEHGAWTVAVHGTARVTDAEADLRRASRLGLESWEPADEEVLVVIHPASVSGRRVVRGALRSPIWSW
jgi:hypothetical protein